MTTIHPVYVSSLIADKKSENTIKNYTRYINQMLEYVNKPVEEISFLDLTAWKASISHLAPASMNIQIAAVRSYFKFLTSAKVIFENPATDIAATKVKNKEKHYMTAEQVRSILNACKNKKDEAIIRVYCTTGLRFSELSGIKFSDYLNMNDNELVILGKGAKERTVYINAETKEAIDKYVSCERIDGDNLFTTSSGAALNDANMNRTIKSIAKRAGIPFWNELSNHALRAAFATIAHTNGASIATISKAMGHAGINVTVSKYIKESQEQINNVMRGMTF